MDTLPIGLNHLWRLDDLPRHHADPFDRLLIAQARAEKLRLATANAVFRKYPVDVFWE